MPPNASFSGDETAFSLGFNILVDDRQPSAEHQLKMAVLVQ